jgi:hypothetical protein
MERSYKRVYSRLGVLAFSYGRESVLFITKQFLILYCHFNYDIKSLISENQIDFVHVILYSGWVVSSLGLWATGTPFSALWQLTPMVEATFPGAE